MGINLNELEQEYNELNSLETLNQDQQDRKNWLENTIGEFKATQREREVHTQEVNETNSDIAISVFDALIPDTKVFESMMGLTEFSDWRSGFYQLFDGALADRTQLMNDKREYDLAQKDEKIRLLQSQGQEIQAQLDVANKQINVMQGIQMTSDAAYAQLSLSCHELEEENIELTKKIETAQVDAQEMQAQIARISADNFDNKNRVAELENKLEAAQTPKEESKPSQSFTDRMNEIKSKNEARIKSAAELAAEGQRGFRGKVILPEIRQQESQFRDFPAIESNSNQLPAAQVDETVGPQFPSAPNVTTVHAPSLATGNVPGESTHEQVAQKTETERIAELERRVEALESKVA